MTPAEATELHTRMMKVTLEVAHCRDYLAHPPCPTSSTELTQTAFSDFWFGSISFPHANVLLRNMRARFDAFPEAHAVLHAWPHMPPDVRALICHWHTQLSDPLYRQFTGEYLPSRIDAGRPHLTRDLAQAWVAEHGRPAWSPASQRQFASKLLSAAKEAGLCPGMRGTRALTVPYVPDPALAYLLHLLRGTTHAGTLLDNPYLRSVGLTGDALAHRLAHLPGLSFTRQGALLDLNWHHPSLSAWAQATVEAA